MDGPGTFEIPAGNRVRPSIADGPSIAVTSPHDALFRFTFSQPGHGRDLLRCVVPPRLAEAIEWEGMRTCPATTADQALRLHHADLQFQAGFRGTRAVAPEPMLVFLLEHKSGPEELLASCELLDRLTLRVLDARSLADLFQD
jgi:hypothetical protein